jgi:hypothetical protein
LTKRETYGLSLGARLRIAVCRMWVAIVAAPAVPVSGVASLCPAAPDDAPPLRTMGSAK